MCVYLCIFLTLIAASGTHAAEPLRREMILNSLPRLLLERLRAGDSQEVIAEFDSASVEDEAEAMRAQRGIPHHDRDILEFKAGRFRRIKDAVLQRLANTGIDVLRDYSHLPMAFLRVRSGAAFERLLGSPGVAAVFENTPVFLHLAQSLPLVEQPQAISLYGGGAGTTVAVLDTGVNYTLPAFGSCTSPGVPSGCKVVAAADVNDSGTNDNQLDDNGHGTNVAGIVLGVAPDAKIAAIDVFDASTTDADILAGIDWAIDNQEAYNIVAINMSLGNGLKYSAPCSSQSTNPYVTPVNTARAAGILPVASSGNEAFTDGISRPACTPGVVSVGAVYDANVGSRSWTACTDSTTAADKVTCFSNSASFLTMLAPGALITAAGSTYGGTSQAAPHAAGAAAVLRASYPGETLDETVARMTGSGAPVTDPRNGIMKQRLNLLAAAGGAPAAAVPALSDYGYAAAVALLAVLGWRKAAGLIQVKGKTSGRGCDRS
jgi:subtilisin family serine protease